MNLSTRLKPRRFSDIVAQISLFRPGPVQGDLLTPYIMRKNGMEPYSAPLPELDEVLRETYQVILYQETVLEVAHVVAGFSLAEGDMIRRAMTKDRGRGAMDGIKREFLERAMKRGVPEEKAREIFGWMEGFSAYGFPKAHAASFAELAYASAYMRVHHPAEFFCGILNSQPMGFYSPRTVLNEARRVGVEVLPPDIHLSGEGFTVEGQGSALRVGLSYCKGLSRKAISSIVSERRERSFGSASDIYRRTSVERDSLENLIKAGFLDHLTPQGKDRTKLLRDARSLPKKRKREGTHPEMPLQHPAGWWEEREEQENRETIHLPLAGSSLEKMEWETLGLNVRHHPLSPYRQILRDLGVTPSGRIRHLQHGTTARVAGLIECLQRPPTKSGVPVYFLLIEDEWGLLQATIFRSVYERYGSLLHHRGAFLLEGRVEQDRKRGFSFIVRRIGDLEEILSGATVTSPNTASASGAFLRAKGSGGRRAG